MNRNDWVGLGTSVALHALVLAQHARVDVVGQDQRPVDRMHHGRTSGRFARGNARIGARKSSTRRPISSARSSPNNAAAATLTLLILPSGLSSPATTISPGPEGFFPGSAAAAASSAPRASSRDDWRASDGRQCMAARAAMPRRDAIPME